MIGFYFQCTNTGKQLDFVEKKEEFDGEKKID